MEKVVNVLNDYAKEIRHDLLNAKQIKNKIDSMKKKAKSAYNCKIHLPCTLLSQKLRWVTGVGCSDQNKRGLRNKALLGRGSERARRRSDLRLPWSFPWPQQIYQILLHDGTSKRQVPHDGTCRSTPFRKKLTSDN